MYIKNIKLGHATNSSSSHSFIFMNNDEYITDDYEEQIFDIIKELESNRKCPNISVDTTFAKRYEDKLKELGIPKYLYHIEEGKYSLYIDGVEDKYGSSSYHLDTLKSFGDNIYNVDLEEIYKSVEIV